MVKGVSKRIIIVKSPDTRLFEQAIFIVRDGVISSGVSADDVLREAERVASASVRRNVRVRRGLYAIPAPIFAGVGAAVTAAAWIISAVIR